ATVQSAYKSAHGYCWRNARLFVLEEAACGSGKRLGPSNLTGCRRTARLCGNWTSLLKGVDVGDQRLDFVVGQLVAVGIHFLFPFFDDAFLDDLNRLFVVHLRLD